jgi:predicted RNase H-like nuclease (RuvC/YqgF family)
MSDILRDFDKKNEAPKHKTDLADEITQALGIIGVYVSVGLTNEEMHLNKLDFSEHDKPFKDKIKSLRDECYKLHNQLMETEKDYQVEIEKLKQRIAELESKETKTCEKEPKISDVSPSMEWYEGRHQSDCIENNRLNTTIDVLIHKVEYLRQFAGLE